MNMRCVLLPIMIALVSCSAPEPALKQEGEEATARTVFTDRVENFFEFAPLHAGKVSQFRIHLTDLSDGTPVEKAEVTLTVRASNKSGTLPPIKARIGKVTGIYVADVTIPQPGSYEIEFHIRNNKLDERMPLTDFKVE